MRNIATITFLTKTVISQDRRSSASLGVVELGVITSTEIRSWAVTELPSIELTS